MNSRITWSVAVLLMFSGLLIAALGAHGPLAPTDTTAARSLDIAVLVQWVHGASLMLLLLFLRSYLPENRTMGSRMAWLVLGGIVLFSGTIYLDVLFSVAAFQALTPVGGVLLFIFWGYWLWLSQAVK